MKPEEITPLSHFQLRTTGEPVFVIRQSPNQSSAGVSFQIVRPVQTKDGIDHRLTEAYAEELETAEQAQRRELDQLIAREKYMVAAQQELQNNPGPRLVKPN